MQRGVVPGQIVPVRECLESGDELLRKLMGGGLIRRIAVVHAASQRPAVAGRAMPRLILPGTRSPLDRAARGRAGDLDQELDLRAGDKQRMTVLLESAAPPAQPANRPESRDFRVQVVVQRLELGTPLRLRRRYRRAGWERNISHLGVLAIDETNLFDRIEPAMARAGADLAARGPSPPASRHFPARKARSGTGSGGLDTPCSRRSCPRRYSRLPASRSGCSRSPTCRTNLAENCSTVSPRNSASRSISSGETHTYPGAPVQQAPHRVQENASPSRYQGVVDFCALMIDPSIASRPPCSRPNYSSGTNPAWQPSSMRDSTPD